MPVSSLNLIELAHDFRKSMTDNDLDSLVFHSNLPASDNPMAFILFHLEGPILTSTQVSVVTNILWSFSSIDQSQSKQLYIVLNTTLHRFTIVEFKACRLLEPWMKWKYLNKLSSFVYHAALLLANSDLWSVETAIII